MIAKGRWASGGAVPGDPGFQDCVDVFDFDHDPDVDLQDFGGLQSALSL